LRPGQRYLPAIAPIAPISAITAASAATTVATASTTAAAASPATTTAAVSAAPATPAASSFRLRPCFIDYQVASAKVLPIQRVDRTIGIFVIIHFDECEPARLSRKTVTD
jgi:hypothetical protein